MATSTADKTRAKIHRVLGMPPMWTDQVDPYGRAFSETFLQDAAILNIMPGVPRFVAGELRNAKVEALESQLKQQTGNGLGLYDTNLNYGSSENWQLHSSDSPEAKANSSKVNIKERDLRFYSFAPNITQFKRAVNILMTDLANRMTGFVLDFDFQKYVDDSEIWKRGLAFFLEASSSVSESASSELRDSALTGAVNQASQMATEVAFLSGNYGSDIINSNGSDNKEYNAMNATQSKTMLQKAGSVAQAAMSQAGEAIGYLTDSKGLTKVASAGEKLIFPKVWGGSNYDKSYNLNFKFISPSGDANSILQYVYFPFVCLLVLALPIQGSVDSIKSPFIIRCDAPGWFSCDMGLITSFSFTRGGSEQLWTAQGLPQCIDVSVSLSDVYPTLSVATNSVLNSMNIGMQNLIMNLSGLEQMKMNIVPALRANMARKITAFTGIPKTLGGMAKDSVYAVFEALFET